MPFRFFTRKKLFPGVTLNMSKSGPSLSFGPRGFKHTVGSSGRRTTIGLPGTGLHYTVKHGKGRKKSRAPAPEYLPEPISEADTTPAFNVDPSLATAVLDRDFLRAVVAYQSGRSQDATNILADMVHVADACWLTGIIELQSANWQAAVGHFEAALRQESDLGQICERNNLSIAINYPITPEVTAHIGPDPKSTRLALVEAYQEDEKLSKALRVLKEMIRDDPSDIIVALSLAEIAFEADDGRKMKMSDLAVILDRANASKGLIWAREFMRARALMRSGDLHDSIDAYARAMSDDNVPVEIHRLAWYEMALTFEEIGDRTRCRQELAGLYAQDKTFADVEDRLRSRG